MVNPIWQEQRAWSTPGVLKYYQSHRQEPRDLYDSERFFLPEMLPQIESVLDVGCATGGFSRIMRTFNPSLHYTGVDISPVMIDAAQRNYPEHEFKVCDGIHFPFLPQSFDLVHSSGVLHLNSRYGEMVVAMWQQTRRYLLCDFRLIYSATVIGSMQTGFDDSSLDTLPYYVLNIGDHLNFLAALSPAPSRICAKGYWHSIASSANLPFDSVIMTFFLLEKGHGPSVMDLDFNAR